MKEFLEEYFQLKGIEYKQSNEQFILRICPFCGDDKFHHFYMSMEEGLWDCKKCGSKGNYNQFKKFPTKLQTFVIHPTPTRLKVKTKSRFFWN